MSDKGKNGVGRDYEVGHGKTPKHTRFPPGRSGNPKGRPKKVKDDFGDVVKKVLSEQVPVTENGKAVKMPDKEVVVRQLVRRGQAGHHASAKEVLRLANKFDVSPFKPPEESAEDKARREEYSKRIVQLLEEYRGMKKSNGALTNKVLELEKKLAALEGREPDPDILRRCV